MIRRLLIMWHVLTGKFVAGYMDNGKGTGVSFAFGGISGAGAILASVALAQQAGRFKTSHIEAMIDSGEAKSVRKLMTDWTNWLDVATHNPDLSPHEFIDLEEKGDE